MTQMTQTTKIIGHRGAAGLELENTAASFAKAKGMALDAVEFDIQITKDTQFVVIHDATLKRISNSAAVISDLTFAELQAIPLHNGATVPLLRDVLSSLRGMPVVLDIKIRRNLPELFALLDDFSDMDIYVASKWQSIIPECKRLRPHIPAFAGQRFYLPVGPLKRIKRLNADGVIVFALWLNPLTYWAAKKYDLQIGIFSINSPFIARILLRLYPGIWICTDRPDKLLPAVKAHRAIQ